MLPCRAAQHIMTLAKQAGAPDLQVLSMPRSYHVLGPVYDMLPARL